MKYSISILSLVCLFFPIAVFAQLEITEIMYDPEGADTGREWIEVYNAGDESVTILGGSGNSWRLHEESTSGNLNKRTFILEEGESSFVFPAKSYMVVANNRAEFMKDHGGFSGLLVESRISLTNSEGRRLVLVDESGRDRSDEVAYAPVPEASNTGASLQKQPGGSWIPALPTPGRANSSVRYELTEEEVGSGGSAKDDEFLRLESDWPFTDEVVYVNAGENRRAFAGEEIHFEGDARLKSGDSPRRASFSWAFGDGRGESGQGARHAFGRAGEYSVVLTVEYEGKVFRDRIRVQVLDRDVISVGEVGSGFVDISNTTDYEVELSGWKLQSGEKEMNFALGTHLLPKSTISVPFDAQPATSLLLMDTKNRVVFSTDSGLPIANISRDDYMETLEKIRDLLEKMTPQ